MKKLSIITTLIITPALSFAGENAITGSGQAGFIAKSGNTDSQALNAALKLEYSQDKNEYLGNLSADNTQESGVTTAEKYQLSLQANHNYNEAKTTYAFASLDFLNDRFADIDLQSQAFLGMGHRFLKDAKMTLAGEAGLGYSNTTYKSNAKDDSGMAVKAKEIFDYKFNSNVKLGQDLSATTTSDKTDYEFNLNVESKMSDKLSMNIGYQLRYTTQTPSSAVKDTDTQTSVSLIYSF